MNGGGRFSFLKEKEALYGLFSSLKPSLMSSLNAAKFLLWISRRRPCCAPERRSVFTLIFDRIESGDGAGRSRACFGFRGKEGCSVCSAIGITLKWVFLGCVRGLLVWLI